MSASGPRWRRADTLAALALATAAFALRALFLFGASDATWPHSTLYEGDAIVWVEWARALRAGQPFEFDLPVRAPGMAFLLAWTGGDLDAPFTGLKLLCCGFGAATVGLFFAALRASLSSRVATLAGSLLALSFGQYELATSLNNEAPYLMLVVGALALAAWTRAPRSLSVALTLGVLHGAATLLRSEHVAFVALLLVVELAQDRSGWRAWGRGAALTALALVATCLPWTLRSRAAVERFNTVVARPLPLAQVRPPWSPDAQALLASLPAFSREGLLLMTLDRAQRSGARTVERADLERVLGEFGYVPEPLGEWTLSSTKGRLDLALANDLSGDGGFTRAALSDRFDRDPPFAFGRPSHLRLYLHGDEVALAALRERPADWLALVGRKLARFESGLALGFGAGNFPRGLALVRPAVDLAVPRERALAWDLPLLLAGAVGLALALRRRVGVDWLAWLGFKLALGIAFYGYARQGVTAQPALHLGLALALDALLERLGPRAARWGSRALLALAALVALADFAPWSRPRVHEPFPSAGTRLEPAPQWGPGAFTCTGVLELASPDGD